MSDATFTAMGIDVGGTKTAIGVVRFPTAKLLIEKEIATNPSRASEGVLNDIAEVAGDLSLEAQSRGAAVSAIGLGLCELVSQQGQILSQNLLNWKTDQVQSRFASLAPIIIEADVRAAALAEALFGVGKAHKIFLFVTVGTGISCCLVLDGVPYAGTHGATGTMASSALTWPCATCGTMNQQILEQIASGPALVSRLNQVQPRAAAKAQDVFAAAANGNAAAESVIRVAVESLGSTIALLVNVLDPEAVVIGGGLGQTLGRYWESFRLSIRNHLWSEIHRDLPILPAGLGVRAGMIGAAAAAWKACATETK